MNLQRVLARELAFHDGPLRPFDRDQRKSSFAEQRTRDRRFAMDEFGAALRRIAELDSRKRVDAAATSVSRFKHGHFLARAPEFAGDHQTRGTCADDDNMVRVRSSHVAVTGSLRLLRPRSGSGSAGASLHPPTPGCSPAPSP